MKRLSKIIDVIQGGMLLLFIVSFIQWLASWIMLLFNWKTAIFLFVLTGISFTICILLIGVWGIVLKQARKEAAKKTNRILEQKRILADVEGTVKVEVVMGYIIWISFYTSSPGALNKQDVISEVYNNTGKMFKVVYEEINKS